MAGDRSKVGGQDRARMSASEQYKVRYFAANHGLSADDASKIIEEAGPIRADAEAAAKRFKSKTSLRTATTGLLSFLVAGWLAGLPVARLLLILSAGPDRGLW